MSNNATTSRNANVFGKEDAAAATRKRTDDRVDKGGSRTATNQIDAQQKNEKI